MFPSFKNKADRESKRQALLNKYNRDLNNDEAKRQAYAEAMWVADVEKNKINLMSSKTTLGTQTDASSATTSMSSQTDASSGGPSGPSSSVFSEGAYGSPPGYTEDIGSEEDSMSDIADNEQEEEYMEEVMNMKRAKDEIKDLFDKHSDLATFKINPMFKREDLPNTSYHLGKDASLRLNQGSRRVRDDILQRVDWIKTLDLVIAKNEKLLGIKTAMGKLKAFKEMRVKDKVFGKLYEGLISKYANEIDDLRTQGTENDQDESDVFDTVQDLISGVENQHRYSKHHRYKPGSEADVKAALETLIVNNRDMLKKQAIVSITKDGVAIGNGYKFDPDRMVIVSIKSKVPNPELTNAISWKSTLDAWLNKLIKNKVSKNLNTTGTNIQNKFSIGAKRGLSDSASSNPSMASKPRSSTTDKGYFRRIKYIFTEASGELGNEQMPLVVRDLTTGKYSLDERYIWGSGGIIVSRKTRQAVKGKELEELLRRIAWGQNYSTIRQYLSNVIKAASSADQPEYRAVGERIQRVVQGADSMSLSGNEIDDMISSMANRTPAVAFPLTKHESKIKVEGRGLMGAGVSNKSGLKGYSNTSKNLRAIQGSGTASDLKYKQLGSKFIRVTDLRLDPPKLKLVYPNRTQVGRMIEISKSLAKVIEVLVFDQNVDQQLYNRLAVNDKQIVHDLLRLCHLETTLRDPPADPLEQLQAEFDKLRSQVMLGNDNPHNIKELKALSLDLYNNRLINDEQMRQILSL